MARTAYQIAVVTLLVTLLSLGIAQAATLEENGASGKDQLDKLDSDFQEVLHLYLLEYGAQYKGKTLPSNDALIEAIDKQDTILNSNTLIRANLNLINSNSTRKQLASILSHLYKTNDTATIRDITQALSKSNNFESITLNYFLLAQYYFEHQHWEGVIAALSKVDANLLENHDTQYAALLRGYALQGAKKHRKSVAYYKKIPSNSPYFAHAKLNEGTAYLRQGWWTEAHIEFNHAIDALNQSSQLNNANPDLVNRIIVTLGFSQIHYEFYRDARETLRKVSLDSEYTNKAMMGLGIAAAHQKDFSGALNIFELLIQKQPRDINVDEAYLLVPFGYEELGDTVNASIKYQQAIKYFELRLAELQQAALTLNNTQDSRLSETLSLFDKNKKEIYAEQTIAPEYFLNNYNTLIAMNSVPLKNSNTAVKELLRQYKSTLRALASQNIQSRQSAINSYLSQAKFGVAKLYDQ